MRVSRNEGTPKWMVYKGNSYQNGWFRGTSIYGTTHIVKIPRQFPNRCPSHDNQSPVSSGEQTYGSSTGQGAQACGNFHRFPIGKSWGSHGELMEFIWKIMGKIMGTSTRTPKNDLHRTGGVLTPKCQRLRQGNLILCLIFLSDYTSTYLPVYLPFYLSCLALFYLTYLS